jgi:hypothetical protein
LVTRFLQCTEGAYGKVFHLQANNKAGPAKFKASCGLPCIQKLALNLPCSPLKP